MIASIVSGAVGFILALAVSDIFDPTIRLLHSLQALIYVVTIALALRRNVWGLGAGFGIGVFWNYVNLFVTTFIAAGAQQLWILVTTGHLPRPDLFIGIVAGVSHLLLIVGCLAAALWLRPAARQWLAFALGGTLAVAYLVAIILLTGPQYVPLLRRIFGLGA